MLGLYVDLETTGLEIPRAAILSFGAVADLPDGSVTEFYQLVRPNQEQWAEASPEALEVNGITYDMLKDQPTIDQASYLFLSWLSVNKIKAPEYVYIGQNPNFDLGFLRHYVKGLDFVGFPFENPVDNRKVYSILVGKKLAPYLKSRKSEFMSEALQVEPEPWPHNALEGARVVRRNNLEMARRLREGR